jgi:hypothetical protein
VVHRQRREWYIWSEVDPGYLGPRGQRVGHHQDLLFARLPPGRYRAMDLLSGEPGLVLEVGAGVGFDGYRPLPQLAGRRTLVLHLAPGEE